MMRGLLALAFEIDRVVMTRHTSTGAR